MGQSVLRMEGLPDSPLDAATVFHATWLRRARDGLASSDALALVFAPVSYDHRGWRLAAVQDLAREAAPKRVNGVVGDQELPIAKTLAWLEQAPGITGQLLAVDGKPGVKD